MSITKSKFRSELREWRKAIFFAFIAVIFIKAFLFEAFTIPTASMESSLNVGDFILVNKIAYGVRMPMTPLSFPFSHRNMPFTNSTPSYLEWIKIPYCRTAGYSSVKNGDVVVFNFPSEDMYPVDKREHFIKRCVGIAGDTLEIKDRIVFINGKAQAMPEGAQHSYTVETVNGDLDSMEIEIIHNLGITQGGKDSRPNRYIFFLTEAVADSIRKFKDVKSVNVITSRKGMHTGMLFPNDENYRWNLDNYGPLFIPQRGSTIALDNKNFPLYQRVIETYEKNKLMLKGDSVFINDTYAPSYTFKMDYYFMMGDNRHDSEDSRYWGFVPEDHIVGKAVTILMSIDKHEGGFRWKRFLKSIK